MGDLQLKGLYRKKDISKSDSKDFAIPEESHLLQNKSLENDTLQVDNLVQVMAFNFQDMEVAKPEKFSESQIPQFIKQEIDNDKPPKNYGIKRYRGVIYTLFSTNCFSLNSIFMKLNSHIHHFNLATWAFPLAALFFVPLIMYTVLIQKKSVTDSFWPLRKHKKIAFLIWLRAVVSGSIVYTLMLSFDCITVADSRTILASAVIAVHFFGWLCLGEKSGVVPIIVAVLAIFGIFVMTRPPMLTGAEAFDSRTLTGVAYALGSLGLSTTSIVTVRFLKDVHPGVQNFVVYSWGFGQSLVLAIIFGKLQIPASGDIFGIFCIGMLQAFGNLFLVLALQVEQAGVVALIRTSEVVFTFFWQFVFLGKQPDFISFLGAILVVTGVVTVAMRKWVASLPPNDKRKKRMAFLLR